jgi:hypothetical protein
MLINSARGFSPMLGNTLVLPQVGGDIILVKINQDAYSSEYMFKNSTSQYNAKIRHTKTAPRNGQPGYDRHNFEIMQTVFAAGEVAEYYRKFYFVWEVKPSETSKDLADAVADLAIVTSGAFLTSLLGWES